MATGIIPNLANDSGTGYCKMPDGTLMCWGRTAYTSVTGGSYIDITVSYGHTFYGLPEVIVGIASDSSGADTGYMVAGVCSRTVSGAVLRLFKAEGTTRAPALTWLAIGRWK